MKKLLLILLSFILFSAFMQPEKELKNDLQKDNIKGAVKSITEIAHKATYGDSGKPVKGDFEYIYTTSYNSKGEITEKASLAKDKTLLSKSSCKFDKKGVKTEMDNLNADGTPDSKETYKYDAKDNVIEADEFQNDGKQTEKFTWKYDDKGNDIEMKDYNEKDSLILSYKYTYDAQSYNTKIEGFNGTGGLISTTTMTNDANGNYTYWKAHYVSITIDYEYTYQYTYDKTGNWIKRLKFQNGYEIEIVQREIAYF